MAYEYYNVKDIREIIPQNIFKKSKYFLNVLEQINKNK